MPAGVRPTEGRLREALFSIWGERVAGARFLDLFAGSGAVGLEALSRGAAKVVLVESGRQACAVAEANARRVAASGWRLVRAELAEGLGRLRGESFDLAFADPPYDFGEYERVIAKVGEVLGPEGELAVEHSVRVTLAVTAGGLALRDQRVYGESALTIYGR